MSPHQTWEGSFLKKWAELDEAEDPKAYVRFLESVSQLGPTAAYKRRSIEVLAPRTGEVLLEVGCGHGDDARALARLVQPTGRVIAIDISATMVAEAQLRGADGVTFAQADAHALPYPDGMFDGCRIDRTLQHVRDPKRVMLEVARVLKPGGRLVATEPDWDSLVINAADNSVTRRIVAHKADAEHPHGTIGRQLPELFLAVGIEPLLTEAAGHAVTDAESGMRLIGLRESALNAARSGAITSSEAERWLADLEGRAAGGFTFGLMGFLVAGRKADLK